MDGQSESVSIDDGDVDRRALLRRGGVIVAATIAGVAASEAMKGGVANAASGDPLVLGQTNDSGTSPTTVTSAATTGPTLALANSGNHAPLTLATQPFASFVPSATGELAVLDSVLAFTQDFGAGPLPTLVFTEITANQVVAIIPQRVIDTRSSSGRTRILNPAGNLDSAGRLLAGHTIEVDLSDYEFAAEAAFGNLTAVAPLAPGFMTLYPGGARPATSSINFAKGQTIANFAVTGTSVNDTVFIFSNVTTHVLFDVTAFNVGSPGQINPSVQQSSTAATAGRRLAARKAAGTAPDWYRPGQSR
jgi:hypothetical protein